MLGSDKVRLKLWRVPSITGQKPDGRSKLGGREPR